MTSYDRDIDEELKEMFYKRVSEVREKMQTTSTKIRAVISKDFGKRVLEVEEKVQEHDGALEAIRRGFLTITGQWGKKKK